MAQRLVNPAPRFFNDSGQIVPEGLLYSYYNLTTSLLPTYEDNALSVENDDLLVLDEYGLQPDAFIDGSYRVKFTDSTGVVLWDRDFIDPAVPIAFAEWVPSYVYGYHGANFVTGSDGNYYWSIIAPNLNNDPVNSPLAWTQVLFLPGDASDNERISEIGAIEITAQQMIIGTGTGWASTTQTNAYPNYVAGLTTSVGTDADHDINIAAGGANDSTNTWRLVLGSAMTKQLDATWTPGTNEGGMASGVALSADTWYHGFLVLVAGNVDVIFDSSPVCANGVASNAVQYFRRIASVRTDSSANIIKYFQFGRRFVWDVPRLSSATVTTTASTPTISTPLGVEVTALLYAQLALVSASANGVGFYLTLTPPNCGDPTVSATVFEQLMANPGTALDGYSVKLHKVPTNTSSQIKAKGFASVGTSLGTVGFNVIGWIDA